MLEWYAIDIRRVWASRPNTPYGQEEATWDFQVSSVHETQLAAGLPLVPRRMLLADRAELERVAAAGNMDLQHIVQIQGRSAIFADDASQDRLSPLLHDTVVLDMEDEGLEHFSGLEANVENDRQGPADDVFMAATAEGELATQDKLSEKVSQDTQLSGDFLRDLLLSALLGE